MEKMTSETKKEILDYIRIEIAETKMLYKIESDKIEKLGKNQGYALYLMGKIHAFEGIENFLEFEY